MWIDTSKFEAQMKRWIVEYVVLAIIAKEDSYSSDILDLLKDNDLIVVEWTLYPLLSRLKNEWFVSYYWKESLSWPPRKYFKITIKGKELLDSMANVWKSMSKSVDNITNFIL